jgi:NADPH:quinone reductase-like Zn-dependent oxidoreductase
MRAAILHEAGATPEVGEFEAPEPVDGKVVVDVLLAGLNPVDLATASGAVGPPPTPGVVGREGVGVMPGGARVYFNASAPPFGSFAEKTLIDVESAFTVPEELSDELAVAIGIAGLAAWIPLTHHARLAEGERVLVLGATGTVGRIAVQAAKILGAGKVVAAGRHASTLSLLADLGADATVVLGGGDDEEALRAEAGDGWDVVIDPVYGDPFLSALATTATGARLVTIGGGAGTAAIPYRSLQGRTHIGHGSRSLPRTVLKDAYAALARHAVAGEIDIDFRRFPLDHAAEAWRLQSEGAHAKVVVAVG